MEATRPTQDKFLEHINREFDGYLRKPFTYDYISNENALFYIQFLCNVESNKFFELQYVGGGKHEYGLRGSVNDLYRRMLRAVPFNNKDDMLRSARYKGYEKVYDFFLTTYIGNSFWHELTRKHILTIDINRLESLYQKTPSPYKPDLHVSIGLLDHYIIIHGQHISQDQIRDIIKNILATTSRGVTDPSTENRELDAPGLVNDASRVPAPTPQKQKKKESFADKNKAKDLADIAIDNFFDKIKNKIFAFIVQSIKVTGTQGQSPIGSVDKFLLLSKTLGELLTFEIGSTDVNAPGMGVDKIVIPGPHPVVAMAGITLKLIGEIGGYFNNPNTSPISIEVATNASSANKIANRIDDLKKKVKKIIIEELNNITIAQINSITKKFEQLSDESRRYIDYYAWNFYEWFEFLLHIGFTTIALPVTIKMELVKDNGTGTVKINKYLNNYIVYHEHQTYIRDVISLLDKLKFNTPEEVINFWQAWHTYLFPGKPVPIELNTIFRIFYEFDGRPAQYDIKGSYKYEFSSSFQYNIYQVKVNMTGDRSFVDFINHSIASGGMWIWEKYLSDPVLPFVDRSWAGGLVWTKNPTPP